MFGTFLIGTVLVTSVVMIYLLVLPSDSAVRRRDAMPLLGAGALFIAILAAAITGLAVSG